MGFPRIISKNNKMYTKLGEFCLSCDGNNFWIICHTCQEELQTQDHFWKHIQDEHNFLHNLAKENHRNNYIESQTETNMLPLPLYRKISEEETRIDQVTENEDSQDEVIEKNYAEMRAIDPTVEIDIKEEPSTASNIVPPTSESLYNQQLSPAYATVVHGVPPALTVPPLAPLGPPPLICASGLLPHELQQHALPIIKDGNSTTASASSAVSSDDGERWYICDYDSCGLKFKYQSRLELHRSVHSKERRFSCDLCGASFKQSCNLSTHRKKKHFLKGSKSNTTNLTLPVLPSQQIRY